MSDLEAFRTKTREMTHAHRRPSLEDRLTVGSDGIAIGKGIVNYSAGELRRIKGLKTAEVRDVLPRASEEAVHRDYFVLE